MPNPEKASLPWKGGYRELPQHVRTAMPAIDGTLITVAGTKRIPRTDIAAGLYGHIGLHLVDGIATTGAAALPPSWPGKWSARNLMGWDRPRPDWGKVRKTFCSDSPNFGDASKYGSHTHYWEREVLQHQIFEPQGMLIEVEVLSDPGGEHVVVAFRVDQLRDREEPEFSLMLLWALNILQENTGVAGVMAASATREDYLGTIALDWEVFPPGTAEEVFARMSAGRPSAPRDDSDEKVRARLQLFSRLEPIAYLRGRGRFRSYFGAQFAEDLVVFENLTYGNAAYILYDDWAEVSKRSQLDLLRDHDARLDRVTHRLGWQGRLFALLEKRQKERGLRARMNGGYKRKGWQP